MLLRIILVIIKKYQLHSQRLAMLSPRFIRTRARAHTRTRAHTRDRTRRATLGLLGLLGLAALPAAVQAQAQATVLNLYSARHYQTDEALYAN